MYKSSSLTFVYKYLFTPIWGGFFVFMIMKNWSREDQFSHDWSRGAVIMVSWGLFWLLVLMFRLRNIEAGEDNLVIKGLNGQTIIDYRNIEYVSQPAMIRPVLISLKYNDRRTGESHNILIMPGSAQPNFLEEVEMTKFIRAQIIKANPNYNNESEPSKWLPLALVLITGVPVGFAANLFFFKF